MRKTLFAFPPFWGICSVTWAGPKFLVDADWLVALGK